MSYKTFIKKTIEHEGLEPNQTPFRITSEKMRNWTSMFDDTIKTKLNPKAKKSKGRENFLYVEKKEDVEPAVSEQFSRYEKRKPDITVDEAVRTFDQTGAEGKLKYLEENGIKRKTKIKDLKYQDELGDEMVRQLDPEKK